MPVPTARWPLPPALPVDIPATAAAYAAAGIPVFPCVAGGKAPLTRHGFQDATTDAVRVASWWGRFPDANIGIPTGRAVDVVDVDVHATGTGFPVLQVLHRAGLISGWGHAVRSPSGGLHLYYPADPAHPQPSWSRGAAHVDFRGTGGYIIAPPSLIHTDRGERRYELIAHTRSPHPVDAAAIRQLLTPAPAPRPVFDALRGQGVSAGRIADWVGGLPEGNRNAGLYWAASRLAEAGLTERDTIDALAAAAHSTGLQEAEVRATIRSAHRSTQLTPDSAENTPTPNTTPAVRR